MDSDFIPSLLELAEKYKAAEDIRVRPEEGAVRISCNKGAFRFFYDFSMAPREDGYVNVPLYHWQQKRRYSELKALVDTKTVYPALSMRIHHVVSRDAFTKSLKDIIIFETNLFEYVTGGRINRVFADFSGDIYTNAIMSTVNNLKASMELGFSPDGSEPVLLHEVVAGSGIASDLPVDTQMNQYPIYVLRGGETKRYNEIDFELYGMDNTEADCIRFILWALTDTKRIDALRENYSHLEKVYETALASSESLSYTYVEE